MNKIPISLINDFKNNNVVLFAGAGLSMNAGLPSWSILLDSLNKSLLSHDDESEEFYANCDQLQKAQFLYDNLDKITVINEIRDIFDRIEVNNNIYENIITLPLKGIITSNWDSLIEESFSRNNQATTKIWKDDQISSIVLGSKTILKIHGTIEDAKSIVFSEDDYYDSFNNNPVLKQYISTIISTSTVLMIGYSYSDFDFKLIYNFISSQVGNTSRKIYILVLNSSKYQSNYYKNRGLIPIEYNGNSYDNAIKSFFKQLNSAVSIWVKNPKERLQVVKRENAEIRRKLGGIVIRNMSALGPLGTPDNPQTHDLFGENTMLEVDCARNWKDILEKDGSTAKYILCLNEVNSKAVYSKKGYLQRIETLIDNINKYKDRVEFVDSGSPLIMSNLDIYGNYLSLENIKVNVNNLGYGYLKVHRNRIKISEHIEIFDSIFNSVKEFNKVESMELFSLKIESDDMIIKMIMNRLNSIIERIKGEW